MKKFLFVVLGTIGIPILLLLGLFLYTDPFKTLHTFDINDIDGTNREYLSTELFKLNKDKYNYNSFVFSSSKDLCKEIILIKGELGFQLYPKQQIRISSCYIKIGNK